MPTWDQFIRDHLPPLNFSGADEAEVISELAQQLEDRYEDLLAGGATEAEARTQAEGQFSHWARLAAEIRLARKPITGRLPEPLRRELQREDPPRWLRRGKGKVMGDIWMDIRYSLRSLAKNPGFALIAVLTIALGTGASTAIFSVVQSVLLRPLPYPKPEQLVRIWDRHEQSGLMYFSVQLPNYFSWRTEAQSFQQLGAYREETVNVAFGNEEPESIGGAQVTASLFDVLGVAPVLGRSFSAQEDVPSGPNLAVITYGLWQRRFGGSNGVLGSSIGIEGQPHTIIGVVPAHFRFPQQDRVEVLLPYRLANDAQMRGAHFLRVLGRLKPGAAPEGANTELNTFARREAKISPSSHGGWTVAVMPLHQAMVGDARLPLTVLLGAVVFLMMIACSNVANLLLVRFAARRREMAVRMALGAGRSRVLRQLLCEGSILSLFGCAAGLVVAQAGIMLLIHLRPADLPRSADISLDAAVLSFSLALALVTGVFFGIAPALQGFRASVHDALREGGRNLASRSGGLRSALLVSEVALAVALLIGAGLLLRSLSNLQSVNPGFQPGSNVITMPVTPLQAVYRQPQQRVAFFRQFLDRIASAPGVESAGIVHRLPLAGNSGFPLFIEGRPAPRPNEVPMINYRAVSSGYFRTLQIPLLHGRMFTEQELWETGGGLLINQAMARRYWPGQEVLGNRIGPRPSGPWQEIIGVVADVKETSLAESAEPALYFPYAGRPAPAMMLVVRSSLPAQSAVSEVRRAARALSPSQPAGTQQTLDDFLSQVTAGPRFNATLLAIFAALALTLASLGVYGVMSYSVAQRTNEIGIRVALGAQRSDVLRMILGQGMKRAALGVLLGIAVSLFLTRWVEALLFGVTSRDPVTYALVVIILSLVSLAACWMPARRALAVDPLVALRRE